MNFNDIKVDDEIEAYRHREDRGDGIVDVQVRLCVRKLTLDED